VIHTHHPFFDQLCTLLFLWTIPGCLGALVLHQALTCSSILCGVE
jgi:hypothetical protein